MTDTAHRVFEVFRDALSLPGDVNKAELVYNEYPGWDSVAHMTLVAALEEAFDCMMDMQEILDMSSFDKSVEIMAGYDERA